MKAIFDLLNQYLPMIEKSNSILALINPDKEGKLVLKEALYFQKTLGCHLFVCNIIKSPSLFIQKLQTQKVNKLKKEAKQALIDFVKNTIQKEIPDFITINIKTGNVVSNLINESQRGGHDLILIDKSKKTFNTRFCKNKIDEFVSKSECPVLTVNKDFPVGDIKKIVIPIDISQSTKKRLLWATLFAKKFNAKVIIVSALNINIKKTKSLAYRNAKKIESMLGTNGVDCETKVIKTHNQEKHKAILNFMEKEKPDLVIIRTHQESIFSATNIGKFVSEIVHGCNMPVFTVNYTPDPLNSLFL